MAIKLEKVQHVKNIKYKGLHPIDKKKTIKKINDLIDKFNGTSEKDYGELEKFLNERFKYILSSYEGLRELKTSIVKFVEQKRKQRVEDFDKFMEITTTDSSSKLDSIEKKVAEKIKTVGELEVDDLYVVERIILKIGAVVNKFEKSRESIQKYVGEHVNNSAPEFKRRGFGAVSEGIFVKRLQSEVAYSAWEYTEKRIKKFDKQFNEFLKSIAEGFSSKDIKILERKIDGYLDKTLDEEKKYNLNLIKNQMEVFLEKMFKGLKYGGLDGKDSFVDKQNRKLIEMEKLLQELIGKLSGDFLELKPALEELKSVIHNKSGKITKKCIEILKKYFYGNRNWPKYKDDAIKEKYNLPMITNSDNETKYTIFSFMSVMIDLGCNTADKILFNLKGRKSDIFKQEEE